MVTDRASFGAAPRAPVDGVTLIHHPGNGVGAHPPENSRQSEAKTRRIAVVDPGVG